MGHKILRILFLFLPLSIPFSPALAIAPLTVVINEIAWMGTTNSANDEWIELYNNTNAEINLAGWGLYEEGGKTLIGPLTGVIGAESYYLIERTDDTTVPNVEANQPPTSWGGYGLSNDGEHLQLLDQNSTIIDEVNCSESWFAGEGKPDYRSMERKDTQVSGSEPDNWGTNNGTIVNRHDAEGNPINGTPAGENSVAGSITQPESQPEQIEPEILPSEDQQKKESPIVYPSGILINEILPSAKGQDELEEWIELKNLKEKEVDISKWKIQDTIGAVTIYAFPEGTKMSAEGLLVLPRPTTKITLHNSGDTLKLIQPDGNITDTVTYGKAPLNQSYNRTESGWTWSTTLTPGKTNIITVPEVQETGLSQISKEKETQTKSSQSAEGKESKKLLTAGVGAKLPEESSNSLIIFLTATGIAISSAVIVLILKKRLIGEELETEDRGF